MSQFWRAAIEPALLSCKRDKPDNVVPEDQLQYGEESEDEGSEQMSTIVRVQANPQGPSAHADLRSMYHILSINGPNKRILRQLFKQPAPNASLFHSGLKEPWPSIKAYQASQGGRPQVLADCRQLAFGTICKYNYWLQLVYGVADETPDGRQKMADKFWFAMSEVFADMARGKVRVLLQKDMKLSGLKEERSVFLKYEYPILKANRNVTEIVTVNSETHKETAIWTRVASIDDA